ncbi:MAG: glucose-1-phosphate adenylyltransferase [Verrucomicrobia bacterium GWC2_42_7]|nr:MAG: glucose-1-phosphate adenylyltransferase [Verrucomicrobia bacterium GWC2_42_7]
MKTNVCCIIMGGGRGSRLYPFTQVRCKPAVPLGGKYRIVDIPISNCLNAGYNKIYLLTQFNTESLHRHVHESYRFDSFGGGFVEILSAEQTESDENWYQGTADAVRQNLKHIPLSDDSLVLILSGDQLYRMDLELLIKQHIQTKADVTIATKAMPISRASEFGVMRTEKDLSVSAFYEKPKDPSVTQSVIIDKTLRSTLKDPSDTPYCLISMGIYVFNVSVLKKVLDSKDKDFGKEVIPNLVGKSRLYSYIFDDYWEDIGTVSSFFEANLMLTDSLPIFNFFDEINPIYSRARHLPGSKLNSCTVEHTVVCDGCIISQANLHRCVIGSRSIIRENSQLENVFMMGADHFESMDEMAINKSKGIPDIGIGKNCYIRNAIIDRNARIGDNVRLSPEGKSPSFQQGSIYVRDGVLCIAKNGVVPDNTIL